jgi:hypothetical protein
MRSLRQLYICAILTSGIVLGSASLTKCQNLPAPSSSDAPPDVRALLESVRQLQSQVQTLNSQMSEMRNVQQQNALETAELRAELQHAKEQQNAGLAAKAEVPSGLSVSQPSSSSATNSTMGAQGSNASLNERLSKLEESQALLNGQVQEQSQTKVESGSKYRVRLSGIVLLNTAITRGSVDNLDFPQVATASFPGTSGSFSGSLRQSQIGVEAFGPDIGGAHTSANINFDFAGGFPDTANGAAFGIVRLRTGTIRFDWANTSLVGGQDSLFFAPLTPTTLTSLAIPALSYTGNLWMWTPQIRIEHRLALSENSSLLLQAGILDSLTGSVPPGYYRYPSAGERSGQPAYGAHAAWTRRTFGRDLTIGAGGFYGRQNWGYGRTIDGWAGIAEVNLPLGNMFELSGEFYRGRALEGLGGGIGQSLLLSGPIIDPNTTVHGLDSMGGWLQLKFRPTEKFEVNVAYGQDNPFAGELRSNPASSVYYGSLLSRNRSPFVNFIYRVRSDVLFSLEYRRLDTNVLDSHANVANQVGISLGYMF